jgi:hypothetical protein
MKPKKLKELIIARHEAGITRSILVESSPGVGKTEIAKQASEEIAKKRGDEGPKVGFKVIHAPLLVAEDYGFPVVSKDKTNVDFVVSYDKFPLEGSNCEDEGIFLIDELSQADTSGQKILANLVQEREIHGKRLKPGWTIIATGNFTKDRAGANRILGHLGNRVCRIELEVSLDDWRQWALANDVATEVVSFIGFRPALLHNYDPQQEINATPRSWVQGVSQSLQLKNLGEASDFELFKGDVGQGPAAEFMAFLKIYRDMPDPDAILLNPDDAKLPTGKDAAATMYALCGALAHRVKVSNFGRGLRYVLRMPPEFSVLFVRSAVARDENLSTTKAYINWSCNEGAALFD